MTYKILLVLSFFNTTLIAQSVADFEEFNLPQDTFHKGADGSGGFISGDIRLPNNYSAPFDAWTGWALSTMQDTLTPGYQNQFSCIAGEGAEQTKTYAVAYSLEPSAIHLQNGTTSVEGMFICNATYPYLSMRDGDAFSKRFGGVDGDDPDFFLLTIKAYRDGSLTMDSVDFYLADFRPADPADDYIVGDWTYVDLSSLGEADSLHFSLSSSDVGIFGMNTPAYFCVDKIMVSGMQTAIVGKTPPEIRLSTYPNPVTDILVVDSPDAAPIDLKILDINGKIMFSRPVTNRILINIHDWSSGLYYLLATGKNTYFSSSVIKR